MGSKTNFGIKVDKQKFTLMKKNGKKSFYILLTEIFYYMLKKKILKAVCLGFVHIPKIGTVSFQIIEQKSVHCCENKMDADAWKASYWILSQNMKKEETKQI